MTILAADQLPDAELVALAQRDRAGFAPLYDRYVEAIYRYCYHRLGHHADAEDAASVVFVRALAALASYQHQHAWSFRSWLFAIAYHVVADHFRHARPTSPLAAFDHIASRDPSPEETMIARHERGTLSRLLRQLPADQQRVIELRLSGLSSPEAGEIMGRSPLAVRGLQFRAVRQLRALLRTVPEPEEESAHA